MNKQFASTSVERIERFERQFGLTLPADYKDFLLRNNGGEPTPDRLIVPGWNGGSTCVNRFFGFRDDNDCDLEKIYVNSADYIPPGFLPIAEDSGGNMLCLDVSGSQPGSILFWDHESPHGDDPLHLHALAAGIEALLEKLLPYSEP